MTHLSEREKRSLAEDALLDAAGALQILTARLQQLKLHLSRRVREAISPNTAVRAALKELDGDQKKAEKALANLSSYRNEFNLASPFPEGGGGTFINSRDLPPRLQISASQQNFLYVEAVFNEATYSFVTYIDRMREQSLEGVDEPLRAEVEAAIERARLLITRDDSICQIRYLARSTSATTTESVYEVIRRLQIRLNEDIPTLKAREYLAQPYTTPNGRSQAKGGIELESEDSHDRLQMFVTAVKLAGRRR